jgi:uncharacterized Fe-S cluster-containing MiaB family protein
MKYFCSKCGRTTQYTFHLPKFCAYCGESLNNNSESENKRNKFLNELKLKKNINAINSEEDSEYIEENYINDIENDVKKINCSAVCDLMGHTIKCITDFISCCCRPKSQ